MNATLYMSLAFGLALLLNTLTKLWLLTRQVRSVAQHRAQVPASFANSIDLPAHQKAADYTLAKSRLVWNNWLCELSTSMLMRTPTL